MSVIARPVSFVWVSVGFILPKSFVVAMITPLTLVASSPSLNTLVFRRVGRIGFSPIRKIFQLCVKDITDIILVQNRF
jgi:hypothetical protein